MAKTSRMELRLDDAVRCALDDQGTQWGISGTAVLERLLDNHILRQLSGEMGPRISRVQLWQAMTLGHKARLFRAYTRAVNQAEGFSLVETWFEEGEFVPRGQKPKSKRVVEFTVLGPDGKPFNPQVPMANESPAE